MKSERTNNERLIAYILIAVGAVTLLSRIGEADWLWTALIAGALLAGYISRKNYGFLVAGSVFAGLAVGEMIGTPSGVLISLGAGFFVVDRLEPRPNRWPLYLAGTLAGVGLFIGLGNVLNSFWVAVLCVAGGAYLLLRDRENTPASVSETAPSASPPSETANTQADVSASQGSVSVAKEETPQVAADDASPKAAATEVTQRPEDDISPALDEPELSADERERYQLLETWRRETAKSEGRPAYIVLRNESLTQIAQQNPQTLDALEQVKGIGPVKLEQYGETILGVLRGETPASRAN